MDEYFHKGQLSYVPSTHVDGRSEIVLLKALEFTQHAELIEIEYYANKTTGPVQFLLWSLSDDGDKKIEYITEKITPPKVGFNM